LRYSTRIFLALVLFVCECFSQLPSYDQAQEKQFHRLNNAWGAANSYPSKSRDLAVLDSIDEFLTRYPRSIFKPSLFSYKLDISAGTYVDNRAANRLVDSVLFFDSLASTKLWLGNILITRNVDANRGISLVRAAFPALTHPYHKYQALLLDSEYELLTGRVLSAKQSITQALALDSTRAEAWHALLRLAKSTEDVRTARRIQGEIRKLEERQSLKYERESSRSPHVFKSVLPFSLKNRNGVSVPLSSERGKILLINFFALWCGACVAELPSLEQLTKDFRSISFLFVDLNDPPAEIEKAILTRSEFRFLRNQTILFTDTTIARAFQISAIPRTLIVDTSGTVRFDYLGFVKDGGAALANSLKSLLDEK